MCEVPNKQLANKQTVESCVMLERREGRRRVKLPADIFALPAVGAAAVWGAEAGWRAAAAAPHPDNNSHFIPLAHYFGHNKLISGFRSETSGFPADTHVKFILQRRHQGEAATERLDVLRNVF